MTCEEEKEKNISGAQIIEIIIDGASDEAK
jgi:hypothetical protein